MDCTDSGAIAFVSLTLFYGLSVFLSAPLLVFFVYLSAPLLLYVMGLSLAVWQKVTVTQKHTRTQSVFYSQLE